MEVQNLCKYYGGVPVLRDVSFSVKPGVTCVMAPSGAGKTTLLRILLGLETADSGTISGDCRWAAVFQEDRLLEHLDAMDNLRFVLGRGLDVPKASALLEELGLGDVGEKPVRVFSGGMKRRLSLLRALLVPFDLLILDEPFNGLDSENRKKAAALVRNHAQNKILLFAAHTKEDAALLGAEILCPFDSYCSV